MKKQILKGAFALGCLTLALFSVVKTEAEKKKPIIMKQMVAAEEVVDEKLDEEIFVSAEPEEVETQEDQTKKDNPVMTVEYSDDEDVSICVFGKAHVSVVPDCAVIFARIETLDNDISLSKENNFNAFERVASAVEEKGLAKENVKLEFFGCQPSYDYSSGKSLNGYYSTTTFSVSLPEIDSLGEYLDILTQNGVTAIDNISYKVSNLDEQYNLTLSAAVENAKAKAEKLAGEGLNLVRVKEECVYCCNNLMRQYSEGVAPTDYLGKVEIEAQVMAVFEK